MCFLFFLINICIYIYIEQIGYYDKFVGMFLNTLKELLSYRFLSKLYSTTPYSFINYYDYLTCTSLFPTTHLFFYIYFSVPKISTAKICIMRPFVHHPYIHWDCCPSQIEKSEYRVRRGWHGHCPILQSFRHCDRPTATTY